MMMTVTVRMSGTRPLKCSFLLGDFGGFAAPTQLTSGSLGQRKFAPLTASRSVHPYLQNLRLWPTNRETGRQKDRGTLRRA